MKLCVVLSMALMSLTHVHAIETTKRVVIVVTSHAKLGTTKKVTGYYLSEVSHPYYAFKKAGYRIDFASPRGGKAPMDPKSRDLSDTENKAFLGNKTLVKALNHTVPLSKINPKDYQAVIFAGGHGTMWDFRDSKQVNRISARIYENGGVVAAVCHGVAALLNVRLENGARLIKDKRITGFSNAEEKAVKLHTVMPYALETELIAAGAKYSHAGLWQSHVVVDHRIVSGQNPASAKDVGEAVIKLLSQSSTQL